MIEIPLKWLLLVVVVVAAEDDIDNGSFERIDLSNFEFREFPETFSATSKRQESSNKEQNDESSSPVGSDESSSPVWSDESSSPVGSDESSSPAGSSSAPRRDITSTSIGHAGYGFYRAIDAHTQAHGDKTRRVYGGATARLEDYPAVCVLLDRFMGARCSGSALTRYWILTAAHCINPSLGYAKYNTRTPMRSNDGQTVTLRYLYKHPDYKVVQEDLGQGMDVTVLHHDMGLVFTRAPMHLALRSAVQPLHAILAFKAEELKDQEVQVLGYGRTETTEKGEELLSVRLRLVDCERSSWRHCMCGVARGPAAPGGVCSGDSGGPVIYNGTQVGVTSMGPLECASTNATWPPRATSVFTAVHPYRDIIKRTITEAERSFHNHQASSLGARLRAPLAVTLVATILHYT